MHRRPTPAEDYRKAHLNPQASSQKTLIKPLIQGLKESIEPISKTRMECASYPIDPKLLYKRLEQVKREQDKELEIDQFKRSFSTKLHNQAVAGQPRAAAAAAAVVAQPDDKEHFIRSLSNILNSGLPRPDVDVQSILDHHVSSVFSPRHTPGSTSPKNLQRSHHRSNEMSSSMPDFGKINSQNLMYFTILPFHICMFFFLFFLRVAMPPIRHSRSHPENASFGLPSSTQQPPRRQPHSSALYRCPSQNIDSGISLYSADVPYKAKEMKSRYVYHEWNNCFFILFCVIWRTFSLQ